MSIGERFYTPNLLKRVKYEREDKVRFFLKFID